jgi:murein DD-endopeptidase MepM/ murein hydrolase activator NlpD
MVVTMAARPILRRFAPAPLRRAGLAACACLALAACAGGLASPSPSAVANATPDDRGVITYASYQAAVAREGDTIASLAARVGGPAEDISRLNGLPLDYRLRAGEVVVLPDSVPRPLPGSPGGWTPEQAAAAIEAAPLGAPATTAAPPPNPFQGGQTDPLIDPVRHRVEPGETAYSIARLYGVSVTALASWNGLGPDLTIRVGQELLIPVVSGANQIASSFEAPGAGSAAPPPPIAATPLPENVAPGENPASPNLGQFRTPPGGRLQAPVAGAIARPYDPASPSGVGFAADVGAPVRSAASGEVALISQEIGGGGSIVLISHADDLMTTYSVLEGVTLEKGDRVAAGQVIGSVAPRERQELQFDVFRGLDPVDPTTYLGPS